MPFEEIRAHGFSSAFGRFYAEPWHVERVEGSLLRTMFLPKLTAEGRRKLDYSGESFIKGQLKHYDVHFNEDEWSGNGTVLFKKILQAGKCDEAPEHLTKLHKQMHHQWLANLTPEQLSNYPDWTMDRYFLSNGQPDQAKTTTVVGIPFHQYSSYHSGQMREAASRVAGLHQKTGLGVKTQTIFMGWNAAAVTKAAEDHPSNEANEAQAAGKKRQKALADQHEEYLDTMRSKKGAKGSPKVRSPIGSYIVNCTEIEEQWPDEANDLTLKIHETNEAGIFHVDFDFGILEGVMMMSTEKDALELYCSQLDREADIERDSPDDTDEDNDERDREHAVALKRKGDASQCRRQPHKRHKARTTQLTTYALRLKCREMGEGEIQYIVEEGTINFETQDLVSFSGQASFACVGRNVPFTARKISDDPGTRCNSWAEYSEQEYELARVNRWR